MPRAAILSVARSTTDSVLKSVLATSDFVSSVTSTALPRWSLALTKPACSSANSVASMASALQP